MSTERIKQLHEQASEFYLCGDYKGALQAWRDVLGLDPADEQAMGGIKLASQFVEHDAPVFAEAGGAVEHELDQGLRVLDGFVGNALPHADVADGSIDREPEPEGSPELRRDEILEGWDAPQASSAEEGSFGLEPVAHPTAAPSAPTSAASAELSRRVNDLLTDAKAKAEAGERDDALAILARLAILDEDNAEAAKLRSKIEAEGASELDKVERAIIEGVAALESERLDVAERYFRDALAIAPEHREAQHYLDKVAERRRGGAGDEELLEVVGSESGPDDNAVHRAVAIETAPRNPAPAPAPAARPSRPPAADLSELPPAAGEPRLALPPPKILIWAGVGVLVLAAAAFTLPRLFGGPAHVATVPQPVKPSPRPTRKAPPVPVATARIEPATPDEAAKTIASSIAKGRTLVASGDFGGAVIAFNEALTLDSKNVEARAGFEEAGLRYKESKAERDALNTIKMAFRDGEFSSALRLAYRLPQGVSKSYTDAVKFAGWYNLAVVALRAGECREAMSHLDEALEIAPADAGAKQLRELAARYADGVKDRAFLDRVEALSFRPLPAS